MTQPRWLTLSNLGTRFGLSKLLCVLALERHGLSDRSGQPTQAARKIGAVQQSKAHNQSCSNLWNVEVCTAVLCSSGYRTVSRIEHISQWVSLLEAMEQGSSSLLTSADQMAEDLPFDLVEEVNHQLSNRGSRFLVSPRQEKHCA